MSHPRDELTALLDGALPPNRAAEVTRHLEGCAACRAEHDRLAAAIATLARLAPAPEPSPFFGARLEARIASTPRTPHGVIARLSAWRWRVAAPAAALAASAAVALVTVRAHRAQQEAIAANLDLLEDYEVVASVGDVESADDAAVVAHLDELAAKEGTP